MHLSIEQTVSCLRGSLAPVITEAGIEPRRFTDRQLATRTTEGAVSRMRSPAGVSLDFYSNTTTLSFTYTTTFAFCRNWLGFDCCVNGNLVSRYFEEPIAKKSGEIVFCFDSDCEKHITVYFPISVPVAIKDVCLSNNATFTPVPAKAKRVLMIGDSILQGMNTRFSSLCLPVLLSKAWQCDILPQAMGGAFFEECYLDKKLPYQPAAVIVALGCNDWFTYADSNEALENSARVFAEKLCRTYPDVKKYFVSPIWSAEWQERRREGMCPYYEVHDLIRRAVDRLDEIVLVNGFSLCGHDAAFLDDRLHPNEIGFQYYADRLSRAIPL